MVNKKFVSYLIILLLLGCFIFSLVCCYNNHQDRPPNLDSDSVSLKFPELGSSKGDNLSGDIKKLIGYAREAEDVSPSLALLNYKTAVRTYFNSSYGDNHAVYHIYGIERLKSSPDHPINKLLYETIPRIKAKAFEAANQDFIECLILLATTSGNNQYEDVLKVLCDIASLIEKYDDPRKADKFRQMIMSNRSTENFCVSSEDSIGESLISRFIDIKNRKSHEEVNLDSLMKEIARTPLKDRPYNIFDDISDFCLKSGNPDHVKDILWMTYEFELNERGGNKFIGIVQKTADHGNYQVLSDLIKKIDSPHYKSKVMEILLQRIYARASVIQYKDIIEQLYEEALKIDADPNYSMFNNQVWFDLALAYHKSGEKQKANEIINKYCMIYKNGKISILTKVLVEMDQKEKAISILRDAEKSIGRSVISKDNVLKFTASLIAGYHMVGKTSDADRLYDSLIAEHTEMAPSVQKRISNLLELACQCDLAGERDITDKVLGITLSEIKKLDTKDFNWKLLYGEKFNALADYDTTFDITDFFNKDNVTYDDPCQDMVNDLISKGKYERAAQKIGYVRIEQYGNQTLLRIADKYIDEGKYEEALKIAELMTGNYSGWGFTEIKRKVAIESARMGNIEKALKLITYNGMNYFDTGFMPDLMLTQIYVAYANSINISEEEQQKFIDSLIPLIKDKNYSMSLDVGYKVRQTEDLELPRRAESDLVQCAYYMSEAYISWRPVNAEMKIDIAKALIEMGQIDEGIKALDRALEICDEFDYDSSENYLPVKRSIADQFIRNGYQQRALDILNQIAGSGLVGKLRDHEIIEIAKAFRDIDSKERADDFVNGIKMDNQNNFWQNLDDAKRLIKALWLVENNELAKTLSYNNDSIPNDSRLIYDIISAALKKNQYDICLKLSDRLDNSYFKYDAYSMLIENIDNIGDPNIIKDIIVKMEELLPDMKDGYRKIAINLYLAKAYEKLKDDGKKQTYTEKALLLVDDLPRGEKDLRLLQEVVRLLKKSGLQDKAGNLEIEIKKRYSDVKQYLRIDQMLEIARQGKFQKAIDCLKNIRCLDNPSSTMANLARIMTDQNEYELAMSTIEWSVRFNDKLECPKMGDHLPIENPYDQFPDIFMNAGRIDLAIKSVMYTSFEKQTLALMNIEKKRHVLGYTLTEQDRKNMRKLIHRDPLYIEYLDKSF